MSSKISKKNIILGTLLVLAVFTRFIKLNWGDNFFFHPDENNMATSVSQLSLGNLNPNFYAYGQFPLYLAYFTGVIENLIFRTPTLLKVSFENAVFILRFYSALFSVISLVFAYLIANHLFKKLNIVYLFLLFLIFNPGLIQMAHFGTTESLLIMIFMVNIYLGYKFAVTGSRKFLFLSAILSGIGVGSKLTALVFVIPIALSLLYQMAQKPSLKCIVSASLFLFTFLLITAASSPYNIVKSGDFISSMNYETQVATGKMKVFYTNQFLYTIPYLFQLSKIFPYSSGITIYLFGLIGLSAFIFRLFSKDKSPDKLLLWSLIIIPSAVYFLYFGQLYTKWYRFMSPIFFIFPLFAAYFFEKINNKNLLFLLTAISLVPGVIYLRLYTQPDIRVTFTRWFEQNIPTNSTILSEAGNVMNLPLSSMPYNVQNFDFYNLDQNANLINSLPILIYQSDYILIPSRRIFKNQTNASFPYSQNYYYNLFFGKLGFQPQATFSVNNSFLLNSEDAEETFSVFDEPNIRIFKKVNNLNQDEIRNLIIDSSK